MESNKFNPIVKYDYIILYANNICVKITPFVTYFVDNRDISLKVIFLIKTISYFEILYNYVFKYINLYCV